MVLSWLLFLTTFLGTVALDVLFMENLKEAFIEFLEKKRKGLASENRLAVSGVIYLIPTVIIHGAILVCVGNVGDFLSYYSFYFQFYRSLLGTFLKIIILTAVWSLSGIMTIIEVGELQLRIQSIEIEVFLESCLLAPIIHVFNQILGGHIFMRMILGEEMKNQPVVFMIFHTVFFLICMTGIIHNSLQSRGVYKKIEEQAKENYLQAIVMVYFSSLFPMICILSQLIMTFYFTPNFVVMAIITALINFVNVMTSEYETNYPRVFISVLMYILIWTS